MVTILLEASNSNHRLKSAVDLPICVLKRRDLCDRMSSPENEARFLHQNEVNLRDRETKWPPTSIGAACICTGSPTQTSKLDLRSPIVDRDYHPSALNLSVIVLAIDVLGLNGLPNVA